MANINSPQQNYDKIQKLIDSSRFNESFLLLKNALIKYPNLKVELEKLKSAEDTYQYMLDYIFDGHSDPGREDTMSKLREMLYHANDALRREEKLIDSPDIYSSTRRMQVLRNNSWDALFEKFIAETSTLQENPEQNNEESSDITVSKAQADILNEIFNYVWTLGDASSDEYDKIEQALENPELPNYLKALIISALNLGNMGYPVMRGIEIILSQFESQEDIELKARSLAGLILILLLHSRHIADNINLRSRLIMVFGDDDNKTILDEALLLPVKTYDTQRIDKKMRDEVIPGLMKLKPEILDKMRNLASDEENFLSDANPDWEEFLEESELGKKLMELNDLQLEGADVMVTAFSNLKSFPFFNSVGNWFLPFIPGYYELKNIPLPVTSESVERILTVMCDSDVYSFLLSLNSMPESQRNLVFTNLENQMKELKEAMESAVGESYNQKLMRKTKQAMQDIYRFSKFFKKHQDLTDPFAYPFSSGNFKPLLPVLSIENHTLRVIAEFYFKNKYYAEAASLFELTDTENSDVSVWEKIAFSYDRLLNFDKAIEWYKKSEIINPDNLWLIKKLAIALKNSGNPKEALEYYEKALTQEPENYNLIMSAAQCLLNLEQYDNALQHFYHTKYLKPDKIAVERAIAWTELLSGNIEKAISNYSTLIHHPDSDKNDFLNAAHAYLAAGNLKEALQHYRRFVELSGQQGITALVLAFRDDADTLKRLKIPTSNLRLIVDKIRYSL